MRINVHPFVTVEDARDWARTMIDTSAGAARARYITITPGQDATYKAKYDDALAYIRAGSPTDSSLYPWVSKEAEETGMTASEAADRIKSVGDPWNMVLGPTIEGIRIGGKDALAAKATIPEVLEHTDLVVQRINLL